MTAFVNHDNKIIFVHTPKTGGTSITDCMVGLSNLQQAEVLFGMPTKNVYYWDDDEGHATSKQLRDKFEQYDDYTSFAVMREPYNWLVSMYEFKNKEKATTFSRFVNSFYETGECLQSHWFTYDGKIDVNLVIDFENLLDGLQKNFQLTNPLRKINVNNYKKDYHYESKEVIKKATELLQPDLNMYEQLFGKRWQPC